jgi:hypothetical protein
MGRELERERWDPEVVMVIGLCTMVVALAIIWSTFFWGNRFLLVHYGYQEVRDNEGSVRWVKVGESLPDPEQP